MKRKLFLLLSFIFVMATLPLHAYESSITSGSYYRFYSAEYTTRCMDGYGGVVAGVETSTSSYSQIWKVTKSGTSYTFQNALTDQYIQTAPGTSVQFKTGTTSKSFTGTTSGSGTSTKFAFYTGSTSNYTALHCAETQSYNVVGWQANADASYWYVEKVTLTSAQQTELSALKSSINTDYTSSLSTFFSDYACTTLKSTYASMTDANLRSAMSTLPSEVQEMAVRVKNDTWNSDATWNTYEKDFRIHDYEIYSNCETWYTKMKIGRFARLSNPTGIQATAGQILYIFVNSDVIDSDATLEAELVSGTNTSGTAVTLTKGYNAVYVPFDCELFITYLLNNADKLYTSYPDIKVHVEGGTCNGCFDMHRGHTNSDWAWLKANMFKNTYLHVKGESVLLNVYRASVVGESNVEGVMKIWDFIFNTEQSLAGCDQYKNAKKYKMMVNPFDNGTTGTNPFWSDGNHGSSHPGITSSGTFSYSNLSNVGTEGGAIWVIMHEIGHGHQNPINLAGQTESSNNSLCQAVNLLTTESGLFQTTRSSRSPGVQGLMSRFNNGYSWIDLGSMRTQSGTYSDVWLSNFMIFQLWLYFDYLGNYTPSSGTNTGFSFMSDLYDALRSDPLVHSANSSNPATAANDYLKLAKYAAQVSQTDLSEFFEAWGFWELEPTVSNENDIPASSTWYMGDYLGYYVKTDQSYVTSVKNAMKSYSKKAGNIMFIEDRCTGSTLPTYNGQTAASFGTTGYYGTYSTSITGTYKYSTSGTRVTISGDGAGAVGFKVYDASGNLVAISNTKSFTVPSEVATGLANGTYRMVAAQGDGSDVSVSSTGAKSLTYILRFNGNEVSRVANVMVVPNNSTETNMPDELKCSDELGNWVSYTYTPATTTSTTTTVYVDLAWNGPFEISTDYNTAHWYTMNGHASYSTYYISTNGDNIVWSSGAGTTDAYKWAFLGDPFNGIKLINKDAGATKYLQNTDPATMAATDHAWTLKRQTNTGWKCGGNGFGFYDASLGYLNTQSSTLKYWSQFDQGSTYWVTDAVSDYLPGVTDLSSLSNNKAYIITDARGTWAVASDEATSMSTTSFLLCDTKQQFAIIKYEDQYFLYNVAKQQLLTSANSFGETPEPVTITATNNATYPWFFSFDSSHNINVNGSGTVLIDTWSTIDAGNSNAIIEVADFDPTDAIAMLDAYYHPTATVTYVLSDANGVIYTSEAIPGAIGATITAVPTDLQRPFCNYSAVNKTLVNGANTVNVTVTYDAPFDEALNTGKLYYAKLRGHYVYYNATNTDVRTNQSTKEATDAYKWSFYGNPYDGIKVKNAATGTYLDNTETTVQLTAEGYAWTLHRLDSTETFGLYNGSNYINEQNHSNHNLIYWLQFSNDTGSQWNIEAVPTGVVDVTYNLVVGGSTVQTVVETEVTANSEVQIPAAFTNAYSTLAYDFTTSGTIGSSDCTITVTATLKAGVVTDLSQLSNSKAYKLVSARGALGSNGTQMVSTGGTGSYTESTFALVNYDGIICLYSVADGKWVGNPTTIAEVASQPGLTNDLTDVPVVTLDNTGLAHPLYFLGLGSNGVNVNSGYASGIVVNSWTTRDAGNQYVIIEAADFDATAPLAAMEELYGNAYPDVLAEVLPYIFADVTDIANSDPEASIGKPFGISAAGAATIVSTYQTQLANKHFTPSEYRDAKAILQANLLYPEDGKTYLVKNTYNNKYLRVAQHGTRGQVFADLTAEEAAQDATSKITIQVTNGNRYMLSEGNYFNWVYGSGYEAYTTTNIDKYAYFVSVSPGVGAFSLALGNGEGTYADYRDSGFYALKNGTTTVAGSTDGSASEYAHWIFEECTTSRDVNKDGDVNWSDVSAIARILTGHQTDTSDNAYDLGAADMDGDGNVTLKDLTMFVNMLLE